jgi:thiamine biosynthesis lipoprotein
MNQTEPAVAVETARQFPALGGTVDIRATGAGGQSAINSAESAIGELHRRLTRFEPDSELSRLNRDPRPAVPSSPLMLRFADLVGYAGELSGGLVDATCIGAVEQAGYNESFDSRKRKSTPEGLQATEIGRREGGADPASKWREVSVDQDSGTVVRQPGVRLDSGGIGKGLAADIGAEALQNLESFAVSCVGDIRFGGTAGIIRDVLVASPDEDSGSLATIRLAEGAIATSGITRRSWTDDKGQAAHHLIDPSSGRPAHTGVVQVTAIAPTGVEAEIRAKAALLAGPEAAADWLVHGGLAVLADGRLIAIGDCVELQEVER